MALLRVINNIQKSSGTGHCTALMALDILSYMYQQCSISSTTPRWQIALVPCLHIGLAPILRRFLGRSSSNRRSQQCSRACLAYPNVGPMTGDFWYVSFTSRLHSVMSCASITVRLLPTTALLHPWLDFKAQYKYCLARSSWLRKRGHVTTTYLHCVIWFFCN